MKETFPLVPASNAPLYFFLGLSLFLVALAALFGYIAVSSGKVRCEVGPDGLRIRGDLYGRRLPLDIFYLDGARLLDLTMDKPYQLVWRTNGTALPGYQSGWFKLRDGEKALVFLTAKRPVLYLPTSKGYAVMVSPQDPEGLLSALRRATP